MVLHMSNLTNLCTAPDIVSWGTSAYVNIDVSIGTGLRFGRNQKVDNQSLQGCLGQIVVNAKPLFLEHELEWMVFLANAGQGMPMK